MKNIPMYVRILIGMLAGILMGFIFNKLGFGSFVYDWIKPFGTIFIKCLKMIAIPLVFVSLLKGILGLKSIKDLSKMGIKTLSVYIVTTCFAVLIGVGIVSIVKPGNFFPKDKSAQLLEKYDAVVLEKSNTLTEIRDDSPLKFIEDAIPDSFFAALSDNSKMLQVIFLSILFGVAILGVGHEKAKPLINVIDAINDVLLKVIDYIMMSAPYGVFALMSTLIIDTAGDIEVFASLGAYAATVIGGLLFIVFIFYPIVIRLFSDIEVKKFIKSAIPVQLLAFSTSSSAATLPVTMEQSEKALKLSTRTTSFVLPVGVTINMDGTSCYQSISILFIAQVLGIDLSFIQILSIIMLTIVSSIGTPGIPGGSIVMTVMVLTSVGIPAEGLVLILGIDRPLDMLRTVVNVTGDMTVASVIDKNNKVSEETLK